MTQPIELQRGKLTRIEENITAKSEKYEIKGNYSKDGDGNFKNISVSLVSVDGFTARLDKYSDSKFINCNIPDDAPDAEKLDIFSNIVAAYSQIKTF